jgi:predicted N-formylglutamate amidohydrolase
MLRGQRALRSIELLVSCEHGGNRIPPRYRKLFSASAGVLATHRAYDPGALAVARDFARAFRAQLFYSTVSRLLVELNRSLGSRTAGSSRHGSKPRYAVASAWSIFPATASRRA